MKYREYISMPYQDKFEYFMDTRFPTNRTPKFWVNWDNVRKNMADHELNLNTLNYLIGKKNISEEAKKLFREQPQLLKSVPILLATREQKISVLTFDSNDMDTYTLDFTHPDVSKLDAYVNFMDETGLLCFLSNELKESLVDYVFGIQAGLDSNGRKNRGGKQNEAILDKNLKIAMDKNTNLKVQYQATAKYIKQNWNAKVPEHVDPESKGGRKYDSAVFNEKTGKVTIIETNFFGSNGSKLKSVVGEFINLYNYIEQKSAQKVNFIWVSDGPGWANSKNPMKEAFQIIPNIFNLKMVQDGFLDEVFKQ